VEVGETTFPYSINISEFGDLSAPMLFNSERLIFGCQNRICQASQKKRLVQLVSGSTGFSQTAGLINLRNFSILVIAKDKQLSSIRL
jgi:hypothetical protein